MYLALIASRLHYAITPWGAAAQTVLSPVQILQHRAVRFMSRTPRYTKLDTAYLNLRLLKLHDIYKLQLTKFMLSYEKGTLPPFFLNYFQSTNRTHNYPTHFANTNTYRPIRCNKSVSQRSIRFTAPTHWNELASSIKTSSKSKFKKEYKNYVFFVLLVSSLYLATLIPHL